LEENLSGEECSLMGFVERLYKIKDNLSVAKFASICGIKESAMRMYFNGSVPSLDKASKIASAKNVSLDWLANVGNSHANFVTQDAGFSILEECVLSIEDVLSEHAINISSYEKAYYVKSLYSVIIEEKCAGVKSDIMQKAKEFLMLIK